MVEVVNVQSSGPCLELLHRAGMEFVDTRNNTRYIEMMSITLLIAPNLDFSIR